MNNLIVVPFIVIERFAARNGVSLTVAASIHEDMLAYLDQDATNGASPTQLVDEAWHSFILHTIEYEQFCMARYGFFMHHVPSGMKRDVYATKVNILLEQNSAATGACQSCNSCGVIEIDRSPQQSNKDTSNGCRHCGGYPKVTEQQEAVSRAECGYMEPPQKTTGITAECSKCVATLKTIVLTAETALDTACCSNCIKELR